MKKNPIELIKEEFATRYNLNPDDIQIDVNIHNVTRELGNAILKDYSPSYDEKYNSIGESCGMTYPQGFSSLWVYLVDEEKEGEEENALEFWQTF